MDEYRVSDLIEMAVRSLRDDMLNQRYDLEDRLRALENDVASLRGQASALREEISLLLEERNQHDRSRLQQVRRDGFFLAARSR